MVGHDAPGFKAVVDAIATTPKGHWKKYEFTCPECATEIELDVFYRTDTDDGGYRATICNTPLHKAFQPMSLDRRSDNPRLVCYEQPVEA